MRSKSKLSQDRAIPLVKPSLVAISHLQSYLFTYLLDRLCATVGFL